LDAAAELVSIENVLAISDGLALICEVNGRRCGVPLRLISWTSEVKSPGDRGRLVIPAQLAVDFGFIAREP
jgi:hypothetical protein